MITTRFTLSPNSSGNSSDNSGHEAGSDLSDENRNFPESTMSPGATLTVKLTGANSLAQETYRHSNGSSWHRSTAAESQAEVLVHDQDSDSTTQAQDSDSATQAHKRKHDGDYSRSRTRTRTSTQHHSHHHSHHHRSRRHHHHTQLTLEKVSTTDPFEDESILNKAKLLRIPEPDDTLEFGKHSGKTFRWVIENKGRYCRWAQDEENASGQLENLVAFYDFWSRYI